MLCGVARSEGVEVGVGEHVVRRRDQVVEPGRGVANGAERFEPWHTDRLAGRRRLLQRSACETDAVRFVLCDLDGVVWLARQAIAGAPDAIARLRASGRRVLFVTNNSFSVVAEQEQALAAIGIPAVGDVVTSSQAAAFLIEPGETVLVCGGPGVVEAVQARGARPVSTGDADAVVVGFHRDFDYERLRLASDAVRRGARLIATNDDATYPTPDGLIPGGGAIVAAVAVASGATPVVAGKPHPPMASLVAERCGPEFASTTAIMVGDRWSTDGLFAASTRMSVRAGANRRHAAGCDRRRSARSRRRRPRRPRRPDRLICAVWPTRRSRATSTPASSSPRCPASRPRSS